MAPEGLLLGIPEIADIAGVGRNAVSNWRKRHSDFPTPAVETPSGLLFDVGAVERWLIENGKISTRIPAPNLLWPFFDALRADLDQREIGDFVIAILVYLEVCERAALGTIDGVAEPDTWASIRAEEPRRLVRRLTSAVAEIERSHPRLAGLMSNGMRLAENLDGAAVRRLCELFEQVTNTADSEYSRAGLFEEARDRNHELARFTAEAATPAALEHLLARLSVGAKSVFDPACGEGGALLLAGQIDSVDEAPQLPTLLGWDVNAAACDLARTRFFLYDVDAEIRLCDSLRERPPAGMDVVILDPPYGLRDWVDAEVYTSERWRYGAPPPKCADLAWVQLALEALATDGRAYVVLPTGSLFRSGREAEIRSSLVRAGVVEAIVRLPARLRRDTSIPLVLWCLRSEGMGAEHSAVLMVDASRLGTSGRSTVTLEQEEIDSILKVITSWATSRILDVDDPRIEATVVSQENIDDANLDPAHYRKEERADTESLLSARRAARADVLSAHGQASRDMDNLIAHLGASQ